MLIISHEENLPTEADFDELIRHSMMAAQIQLEHERLEMYSESSSTPRRGCTEAIDGQPPLKVPLLTGKAHCGPRVANLEGFAKQVLDHLPKVLYALVKGQSGVPAWRGFFRSLCLLTMRDSSAIY